MLSSISVLTAAYKLLNVEALTSEISGEVYKVQCPSSSQLQDVEVNLLTNANKYVQQGYINVNIYCIELSGGMPNNKSLEAIRNIAYDLIHNKQQDGVNFQVENESGVLADQDRDSMFFINLKVNFQTL